MFDWVGAGLGLLGSILGGEGEYSNPNLQRIFSEVGNVDRAEWDLFNNHGTWDQLYSQDMMDLADMDKIFTHETDLDRRRFMSENAEEMMPGQSDSEWALAQAAISGNLAQKRYGERARLSQNRAMRSKALMPDAGKWTALTGAASEMDRTANANMDSQLGWSDLVGVLSSAFSPAKKKQGAAGGYTGGSDAATEGVGQTQAGNAMAGTVGGLYPQSPVRLRTGGGLGGGSTESVNARYGGTGSIQDRVADMISNGDPSQVSRVGVKNRVRPKSR